MWQNGIMAITMMCLVNDGNGGVKECHNEALVFGRLTNAA